LEVEVRTAAATAITPATAEEAAATATKSSATAPGAEVVVKPFRSKARQPSAEVRSTGSAVSAAVAAATTPSSFWGISTGCATDATCSPIVLPVHFATPAASTVTVLIPANPGIGVAAAVTTCSSPGLGAIATVHTHTATAATTGND
jgi:hypothetical protein